jgi:hypothetical protein
MVMRMKARISASVTGRDECLMMRTESMLPRKKTSNAAAACLSSSSMLRPLEEETALAGEE